MGNVYATGPNEALVISGGCGGTHNVRTVIGGWGWAWWRVSRVQKLSLRIMTLKPTCEDVETLEGVALTVTGVAQVKVMREEKLLQLACEQFLSKSSKQIENTILQTLEGHLRAILGTLSVEQIYRDRERFAMNVRDVAAPDVGRMGIEILSFTIKDVSDRVDYLKSLGRAQIAKLKRDADIGVAEAERDAVIKESECKRAHCDAWYEAHTRIVTSKRDVEIANAYPEVNAARAEADLAHTLQTTKEQQKISIEEVNVMIVERRKQIELEEQEILCAEKKMDATVRRPAEAEAFRVQQLAEGNRLKKILLAQAEAHAIRVKGEAKAAKMKALGEAEAERMRLYAETFAKYGDAATLDLFLNCIPRVAAEIAAPLARTKEIVVMGDSRESAVGEAAGTTGIFTTLGRDLTNAMATVNPVIRALTNVDLSKTIGKIPGATIAN